MLAAFECEDQVVNREEENIGLAPNCPQLCPQPYGGSVRMMMEDDGAKHLNRQHDRNDGGPMRTLYQRTPSPPF